MQNVEVAFELREVGLEKRKYTAEGIQSGQIYLRTSKDFRWLRSQRFSLKAVSSPPIHSHIENSARYCGPKDTQENKRNCWLREEH